MLLAPPFKQNRFLVFFIHWMAWLLLHFIVFLPTLLSISKINWESFLFVHFILVTTNFLLFYIVAFYITPYMGNLRKKWFLIVIVALLLAIVFTYLRFRLEMYRNQQLLNTWLDKFTRSPVPEDLGLFSSRFRTYFQTNILTNVSIVILGFAYRLLLIWFQQEKIRKRF